ncbi:helix-turn-helix transcriptional regulator [Salmonella enterica]|nr:helix-turn-helix transcriptional regulator [Salmonella enterica]
MSRRDTDELKETEKLAPVERRIFGNNFRKARLAKKLTQRDVYAATGISQAFISNVENGVTAINLDNMAELARCVDVPLWQLLVPSP